VGLNNFMWSQESSVLATHGSMLDQLNCETVIYGENFVIKWIEEL
jgi:hypothetical protein